MRWLRHPIILLTLLGTALVLVALSFSPRWTQKYFARELAERIAAAEEAEAVPLVPQLAALGDAALPYLVALLDDSRQEVRIATRDTLRGIIAEWGGADAASDTSAAALAAAFAEADLPRDLYSRVFVKVSVLQMLRRTMRSGQIDSALFLDHCNLVLERTGDAHVSQREPRVTKRVSMPRPEETAPFSEPLVAEPAPAGPIVSESISSLPELPLEQEPELLPRGPERILPPLHLMPHEPREAVAHEVLEAEAEGLHLAALRALPTRSLIRHLQGVEAVSAIAERELLRRGFTEQTLQFARALDHPDREIRLKLVEALPSLNGVEAATWLWELAKDHDETVREAARNILATSNNPLTRRRVQQLR